MKSAVVLFAGVGALLAPTAWAQEASVFAVGHGRALYLSHCAACHGAQGVDEGGRPVGSPREGVPNLTLIAVRDGSFRPLKVANHISGRLDGAPDRTMPRWTVHVRNEWPADDSYAAVKVFWLTKYLDSVQEAPQQAKASVPAR